MAKVLVTGAAGAIGLHLARYLADRGDRVYVVDDFVRGEQDDAYARLIAMPNVVAFEIDLRDGRLVEGLPEDIEYIFHLAALNGTQNFYDSPFDVLDNSTIPTVNLLRRYSGSRFLTRFVYGGSSEAYASTVTEFDWPVPTDERVPLSIADPLNPRWSYAASKLHGEIACVAAGSQFGAPFTIIRYHNVYGPRMGDKHVIPDFLERARKNIFELYGFQDTRSFIYVTDAVRASVAVAESESCEKQIVNVGGTEEISMLALAEKMMAIIGQRAEIVCRPSPEGSVRRRVPDLRKLMRLTRYVPQVSLDEGLRKTTEYYFGDETKKSEAMV